MNYDLIVIGGGPGGLMAARTAAAEDGMKVLLLERKQKITEINRGCLQIAYIRPISPLAGGKTFIEPITVELHADKAVLHYPELGFSVDYNGPLRPYLNWIQVSPGGYRLHRWKPDHSIFGYFIQKEALAAGLLAAMPQNGVDVITGATATGAELTAEGGVKVSYRDKSGERTVTAHAAIAADGNTSRIVESLGFNEKRQVLMPSMKGLMHHVSGIESDLSLDCSLASFSIPTIDTNANAIIGMMADNTNSICCGATPYSVFQENPALAPMLAHAKLEQTRAYNLVIRTPIENPVAGNVVVIGDAASPMEAHMAGAIACGHLAVKAIVKELNGVRAYPEYNAWWQRAFAFNQPDYFKIINEYYAWNKICTLEEVDFIFELFADTPGIPMVLIEENMALIKQNNPGLHEKLAKRKEINMWH
jgi:flavin-dependent dehydrogenase